MDPLDIVDDANCTVQSIQEANHRHYFPIVDQLTKTRFFRFFKVDLESECPFWAMQAMCGAAGGCDVCKCDDDDVPIPWKITKVNPVNTFLGKGREKPKPWVDSDRDLWFPRGQDESRTTYVNLLLNPETNTGYSGREANRVWQAIYTENCFKGGRVEDMCFEERVFFRLLSGLHSSITMKVATYHYKRDPANNHIEHNSYDMFAPNYEMFEYGIAKFPDRLKNLYFLYSFILRAIHKAQHVLLDYEYNTGNPAEDRETKELVRQLLEMDVGSEGDNTVVDEFGKQHCRTPVFDETVLFSTSLEATGSVGFKEQMRDHFRNISMIMDCVACEKCRMWSKLETLGLATALKIVLSENPEEYASLQRNEIIALINSFKQHSQSIEDLLKFNDMRARRQWSPIISYTMVISVMLLAVRLFWILVQSVQKSHTTTDDKRLSDSKKED